MKIASFSVRKLCERLSELIINPPKSVIIGRLAEGPTRWFGWQLKDMEKNENYGYELKYYCLVEELSTKCHVEHFVVCPTYYHESSTAIQLTSLTKMTKQGIMVQVHEDPIMIWKNNDMGFRGHAHRHKLCMWIEHWEETKKYFHNANYILWGEDATNGSKFKDKLFHYEAHGMKKHACDMGKNISHVRERFVTKNNDARLLVEMFHTQDFKYSGEVIGEIRSVHKDTFKKACKKN